MKAAVLYGKEDLRVEQVAMPVAGAGEVVVRVEAALTCGTDLKVYKRGYHAAMLTPPMLFGHEVAGVVEAVGAGVEGFAVGDRVLPMNSAPCGVCFWCGKGQENLCEDLLFNNGAYAEFIRVPARIVEKNMLRVPGEVAMAHAALTEPLACVVRGMEESGVRAGESLVVIGAGPIGLMFVHAAALAGVRVTAVVKREDQAVAARGLGAERVVMTSDRVVEEVRDGGCGADVVVEAVGVAAGWEQAVGMVRKGGVVNFFAGPPSGTVVELDTNRLHYGDITLKASFHHTPGTCRTAFGLIASGRFDCGAFLTGEAGLEEVPGVFAGMMTRSGGVKTVVRAW